MKNEYEAVLKTKEPGKVVVVSIYYDKGGANYFAGTTEARGYYLSVCPEERTESGMRIYRAFSGQKRLILPVSRKGAASSALAVHSGLNDTKTADMIKAVTTANGLELADEWK